jgi:ABC-type multidrug transport system ATPase subunit
MLSLETHHLSHRFSSGQEVLRNLDLAVEQGAIYGFLGPNGAGKTTTLRLILGLLKRQQGSIIIFGKTFDKNRIDILRRVGSLIESPSLYGHLSAKENLTIFQKVYRCAPANIPHVLALVGLSDTGRKKASQFSLGMKQRLAIAVALLPAPELLILDEPTNGLDPNGIIEMRELLKTLNREQGTTILVSSHLLAEIEKLVTHLGIIHQGELIFQGTLDALKHKQQQTLHVVLETGDPAAAMRLLLDAGLEALFTDGCIRLPAMTKTEIAAMNRTLVSAGIEVYAIRPVQNDLESIFIDLINP